METISIDGWESFEATISAIRQQCARSPKPVLFRGLADSAWPLSTTLERFSGAPKTPFADYYRHVSAAEPELLSFEARAWDEIESYPDIAKLAGGGYQDFDMKLWGGGLSSLGYLAFLRHHGFPSPLLDWSRSPYVAAFFAFRSPTQPTSGRVSIYVYCEMPDAMKSMGSSGARIFHFGRYVRTHPRHYLQQGEYTMCLRWTRDEGWELVPHRSVFDDDPRERQDLLWKIDIPWAERVAVLRRLDAHNINAFSLFDTTESLLETIALRGMIIDLRQS